MNFLLHLRLNEIAGLPPAGAIIGDVLRGRLDPALPAALARSIALHRRIDALSDRHPLLLACKVAFPASTRRHAGIVLDLLCDHVAAIDWSHYGGAHEALSDFARRMADAVADERAWRISVARSPPAAGRFAALLCSYATEAGIDRALGRVAERLRQPQRLLDAGSGWRIQRSAVSDALPRVFADLAEVARGFPPD